MLRPMIPLTIDIAILDKLTRNTCFETNALSCHAAQSTSLATRAWEEKNKLSGRREMKQSAGSRAGSDGG